MATTMFVLRLSGRPSQTISPGSSRQSNHFSNADVSSRAMLPEKTFENRVGIITGGGTGIGFAIARELAKLGATVIIASRSEEHLGPAVEQLRSETGRANAAGHFVLDVREPEQVEAMARKATANPAASVFLATGPAGNS